MDVTGVKLKNVIFFCFRFLSVFFLSRVVVVVVVVVVVNYPYWSENSSSVNARVFI